MSNVSSYYRSFGLQSSSELRKLLLSDSLNCLKIGTDWEHAIEVSNELVYYYQKVNPDFESLSKILVSVSFFCMIFF